MTSLTAEQNITWFRGFIQGKTRKTIAWIFAFLMAFSAREYPALPGIVLFFLGACLRYWASGFLKKDSRPAVGGPYAFVRNPLYLGTYLMAVGTVWSIENWPLLATVTVFFAVIYHYIILDEEVKLKRIFGEPYVLYGQAVPRFFPRIFPPFFPARRRSLLAVNPDPTAYVFSGVLAMKNKAYESFATFVGLIGLVSFVAFLWKTFQSA